MDPDILGAGLNLSRLLETNLILNKSILVDMTEKRKWILPLSLFLFPESRKLEDLIFISICFYITLPTKGPESGYIILCQSNVNRFYANHSLHLVLSIFLLQVALG